MYIGLLGPLEVNGRPAQLPSPKARGLLSVLALHVGTPVPAAQIEAALWGDTPPPTARKAIQGHVSTLRRSLADITIETSGGGYRLVGLPDSVDVHRFEERLAQGGRQLNRGNPEEAAAAFEQALSLWRGAPLPELADQPIGVIEIARLNELRWSAEEELADAKLACGEHHAVVAELARAVASEPLRERRWAQMMLALYRCGRQAEALRAYQRLRDHLGVHLGIEPSTEAAALEAAILLNDSALTWQPSANTATVATSATGWSPTQPDVVDDESVKLPLPIQLDHAVGDHFVGRSAQQAALSNELDATIAHDAWRMALVTGSAGMGKTTLVSCAGQSAHASRNAVLYGRCDDELSVPYQPFIEAMNHYATYAPDPWLAAHNPAQLAELARLAPVLSRRIPDLAPATVTDPDVERHLLFAAVATVLSELSIRRPVMIILDDLHWADRPTLQLLRYLTSRARGRTLVIGCYRHDELTTEDPLVETLGALRRQLPIKDVRLSGLSEPDILAVMETTVDHHLAGDTTQLARMLRRETDGNPFFVTELLQHLVETGAISPAPGGDWTAHNVDQLDLPDSVRQVVAARTARLNKQTRDVLAAAAVIGQDFDLDLLARCTSIDAEPLASLLEQAKHTTLLTELAAPPGRFQFRHSLVHRCLYDEIGPTRRALLHRRVGQTLEMLRGAEAGERASELAHHFLAGGRSNDVAKAASYSRVAGDHALAALAPSEASRYYTQALAALEGLDDDHEQARCLVGLGDAQRQLGLADSRETLLSAARLAKSVGDATLLVRAALASYRGLPGTPGTIDAEKVEILEAALKAECRDTPERARLLATLALEYGYESDYTRRLGLADEAVALARRIGDRAVMLDALARPWQIGLVPELADDFRQRIAQAVAVAERGGDPMMRFWAHSARASLLVEHGQIYGVDHSHNIMAEIAQTLGHRGLQWIHLAHQSWRLFLAGDIDKAEHVATDALNAGLSSGQPDALLAYAVNIFTIRQHQGRAGELLPMLDQAANDFPDIQGIRSGLAIAALQAGRDNQARELLDTAQQSGFDLPKDVTWLTSVTTWAEVAADLREPGPAQTLYDLLTPWHDRVPIGGAAVSHCVAHTLGRLADLLGRHGHAIRYFTQALTIHQRLDAPHFAAQTKLALAAASAEASN